MNVANQTTRGGWAGTVLSGAVSWEVRRRAILAVYVIGTLGFAALALHRVWSLSYPFDDAFISFRYADNLARGRGVVYNPGEPVEGYTNFLWVLLTAGGITLGLDPLDVALFLGKAAFVASVVGCALLIFRGTRNHASDVLGLAPLAWLVFATDYEKFAASGLETTFFGAQLVAFAAVEFLGGSEGKRRWLWLHSLLPTTIVMTRPDGVLFVAAGILVISIASLRAHRITSTWLSSLGATALSLLLRYGVFLAAMVCHGVWKVLYYGSLIPNTAWAKRANDSLWESGLAYLKAFPGSYPHVLILLVLVIVAVGCPPQPHLRRLVAWGGLSIAAFLIYLAKVGGDFMHYRFAFEIYPLLVGFAGLGLLALARLSPAVAAGCAALAFAQGPGAPELEHEFGMQSIPDMVRYAEEGKRVGTVLREKTPPETILATTLAGTIAYYGDRVTIDQWGLNDRYVARLPGGTGRGHMKKAPAEYLRSRNVNLELGHPHIIRCFEAEREAAKEKDGAEALVNVRLSGGDCLKTKYLVRTHELTRWFCDRPADFVLDGVACSSEVSAKASSESPSVPVSPAAKGNKMMHRTLARPRAPLEPATE
jgi:hypothetical protein